MSNDTERKDAATQAPPKSARDELRSKLLSSHKPKTELLTLFGVAVEFRQPTLDAILAARDNEDVKTRTVDMIIQYAYVPETNERVFEPADRDQILSWPFGEDMIKVQQAITILTGVDVGKAEKELKSDPLEE